MIVTIYFVIAAGILCWSLMEFYIDTKQSDSKFEKKRQEIDTLGVSNLSVGLMLMAILIINSLVWPYCLFRRAHRVFK